MAIFLRECEVRITSKRSLGRETTSRSPAIPGVLGGDGILGSYLVGNEIIINALKIYFKVEKKRTGKPSDGLIKIHNMSLDTEHRIRETGERVRIYAGYRDQTGLIFDGDIRGVERARSRENNSMDARGRGSERGQSVSSTRTGIDRVTTIMCGGFVSTRKEALFNRTYESKVPVRQVVKDAVATMTGLSLGPIDIIPPTAMLPAGYKYTGKSDDLLEQILEPLLIRHYVENRTVRVAEIEPSNEIHGETAIIISEDTGMIGSPTVTSDDERTGLEISMLLNPALKLDEKLQVRSRIFDSELVMEGLAGNQIISALQHEGDNRDGPFATTIRTIPISRTNTAIGSGNPDGFIHQLSRTRGRLS